LIPKPGCLVWESRECNGNPELLLLGPEMNNGKILGTNDSELVLNWQLAELLLHPT